MSGSTVLYGVGLEMGRLARLVGVRVCVCVCVCSMREEEELEGGEEA